MLNLTSQRYAINTMHAKAFTLTVGIYTTQWMIIECESFFGLVTIN